MLVEACRANVDASFKIVQNTRAVIFFGTPHRMPDMETVLRRVFTVTQTTLPKSGDLQRTSDVVGKINKEFVAIADQFKLITFFESTGIPPFGVLSRWI